METHPDILAVIEGRSQWCVVMGDCLEILPTIPVGSIGAVVTDPPYGVGVDYGNFDDTEDAVRSHIVPACEIAISISIRAAITPGTRCAWFYPRPYELGQVYFPAGAGFSRWGFTCSQPVLYYGKDPYPPNAKRPNSWACTSVADRNIQHPCPKPEEWMMWLVQRASLVGEIVLDPFTGSGTTGVAAIQTGRRFIGIEIDEKYAAIARRRIADAAPLFVPPPHSDDGGLFNG